MRVILKRKLSTGLLFFVALGALTTHCTSDGPQAEEPIVAEETQEIAPMPEVTDDMGLEGELAPDVEAAPMDDLAAVPDAAAVAIDLSSAIVYFGYDQATLTGEAETILSGIADQLKANPELKFQIEGHCDNRGTDEYNLALGQQRAESVKSYLINLGVAIEQLETISYGESKPVSMGEGEEIWQLNRRAVFTALSP